jgi:hypothetical protein
MLREFELIKFTKMTGSEKDKAAKDPKEADKDKKDLKEEKSN